MEMVVDLGTLRSKCCEVAEVSFPHEHEGQKVWKCGKCGEPCSLLWETVDRDDEPWRKVAYATVGTHYDGGSTELAYLTYGRSHVKWQQFPGLKELSKGTVVRIIIEEVREDLETAREMDRNGE